MLFFLAVLGGIISLPGSVLDLFKRPDKPGRTVNPPVAAKAESKGKGTTFMDALWNTLVIIFPKLVSGVAITLVIFVFSAILSMAIAIPVGLGRVSRSAIIRTLCTFYVEQSRHATVPPTLSMVLWYPDCDDQPLWLFR